MITQEIEYSLILLLIYIIVRSTARSHFSEDKGKGAGLLIIFIGVIIFLFINDTIGIITILAGIALLLIPEKKTKNDEIGEVKN